MGRKKARITAKAINNNTVVNSKIVLGGVFGMNPLKKIPVQVGNWRIEYLDIRGMKIFIRPVWLIRYGVD